jgi:hypothetical protein
MNDLDRHPDRSASLLTATASDLAANGHPAAPSPRKHHGTRSATPTTPSTMSKSASANDHQPDA